MRLDVLIVFNIQLCLICTLIGLLIPFVRRYLPHIPSPLFAIGFYLFSFLLDGFWTDTFGTPLFYLPFPLPALSSPIPAFAAEENLLLQRLWLIYIAGAVLTAVFMIVSHALFRLKLKTDRLDCPQRVTDIAERVFREKLHNELMDRCKFRGREPREKELLKIQTKKLPRIMISDHIRTPGVLLTAPSCILLDRADYTDEQLKSIFFYAFHRLKNGSSSAYRYMILFRPLCWFNPLFWFSHRILRTDDAIQAEYSLFTTDEEKVNRHDPAFYKMRKAAHEKLLDDLTFGGSPSRHFFPLGGNARQIERRKKVLKRDTLGFNYFFYFAAMMLFMLVAPMIVQPSSDYRITEQSMFSVLGADSTRLRSDIRSYEMIDLFSAQEDGQLYGADKIYASTNKEKNVVSITLDYHPGTDPAILEANVHRLFDALYARLGAYTDTAAGALLRVPDLPKGLNDSTPIPVKQSISFRWTTETADGETVTVRMSLTPDGANYSEELRGGLCVRIEMY